MRFSNLVRNTLRRRGGIRKGEHRGALQHRRKLIAVEQVRTFESVTGALFTGQVATETTCGNFPAVTVEVSGMAHFTGESTFYLEDNDTIGMGFLMR